MTVRSARRRNMCNAALATIAAQLAEEEIYARSGRGDLLDKHAADVQATLKRRVARG